MLKNIVVYYYVGTTRILSRRTEETRPFYTKCITYMYSRIFRQSILLKERKWVEGNIPF